MHYSYEDGRIKQDGDILNTCSITIKKAKKSDTGMWKCSVSREGPCNNGETRIEYVDVTVLGNFQYFFYNIYTILSILTQNVSLLNEIYILRC